MSDAVGLKKFIEAEYRQLYEAIALASVEGKDPDGEFLGSRIVENLHLPQSRVGLPTSVLAAYDFYNQHCDDYGGSSLYKAQFEAQDLYIVRVTTDGDDGWVELFDAEGQPLAAGRTYIELISWGSAEEIRSYSGTEFPPALADRQTQTKWDEMVASAENSLR